MPGEHTEIGDVISQCLQSVDPASTQLLHSSNLEGNHDQEVDPVDVFLDNITCPVEQPLLPLPTSVLESQQAELDIESEPAQRKSSRLAEKAKARVGKTTMKVAQDLLSKKLGELQSDDFSVNETNLESFSQHLDRPITEAEIEALQILVDHGTKMEKKVVNNKGVPKKMVVA